MTWQGVLGHDETVRRLRASLKMGRLASTFLFVGPPGIGKRLLAERFAMALLCPRVPPEELAPCGVCASCKQVLAGSHPDLHVISKPADKRDIPIDLLLGAKERRGREGLCAELSLKPLLGLRRVAIIDDADHLNAESANSLLKTLEEPPPRSVLILIGTSPERQLPTIRSRCQIVRLPPLTEDDVTELLVQQGMSDPQRARQLARHSGGSVSRALQLDDEALWNLRREVLSGLAQRGADPLRLSARVAEALDAAGRDAQAKRAAARQIIEFAAELYGELLRTLCGGEPRGDTELQQWTQRLRDAWRGDADTAAEAVERCLTALANVDENVYLPLVIDAWIDDLWQLAERGRVEA